MCITSGGKHPCFSSTQTGMAAVGHSAYIRVFSFSVLSALQFSLRVLTMVLNGPSASADLGWGVSDILVYISFCQLVHFHLQSDIASTLTDFRGGGDLFSP